MSLISKLKNDKKLAEFTHKDEQLNFISTGVLPLNILFSGKLDGGIPIGRVSQHASDSAEGKSFVAMKLIKNAQKLGMECILIDTEFAYNPDFADNVGVDRDKLFVYQNNQIEDIQSFVMKTFEEIPMNERKDILLIIDSWNNTVTSKTVSDSIDGKDVQDMTISKKRNTLSKLLTGLRTTVYVVNQVISTMDQYAPIAIPGGKGLYFSSSCIVMGSSKAKHKDSDGDVAGVIITANTKKSRLCKEYSRLKYLITHDGGIHPVWGLDEDLFEFGILTKPSMGWYSRNFELLGLAGEDKKWRAKDMLENWKEFYAPIISNEKVKSMFQDKYAFTNSDIVDIDDVDDII
jgi:recombination protein RecA